MSQPMNEAVPPSLFSHNERVDLVDSIPSFRVGGVPEHFNLPWHLAIERDEFRQLGMQVAFREFGGGTGAMLDELESGSIDLALVLTEGCLARQLAGSDIRMVKVYVDSPLCWGIHVSTSSPLIEVAQTRGQRYAISRFGSGSHLMALVDYLERDWPLDDLEFVEVNDLPGARQSLAQGEADVFLWEKYTSSMLVETNEFRRLGDRAAPWPAFVVAVRNETIQQYQAELKMMLELVQQTADRFARSENAVAELAGRYRLKPDQVACWLAETRWSQDFDIPLSALRRVWQVLQQINQRQPSVGFSSLSPPPLPSAHIDAASSGKIEGTPQPGWAELSEAVAVKWFWHPLA